jgi:hypothetical protein
LTLTPLSDEKPEHVERFLDPGGETDRLPRFFGADIGRSVEIGDAGG